MRFWDSSAIVPLVCREKESGRMQQIYAEDPDVLVWAFSSTEVLSALRRHARSGSLSRKDLGVAKERLRALRFDWSENRDYGRVRDRAERLLEVHVLSAADGLQLAAALVAVDERSAGFGFVTFDERLAVAAEKEGFALYGAEA